MGGSLREEGGWNPGSSPQSDDEVVKRSGVGVGRKPTKEVTTDEGRQPASCVSNAGCRGPGEEEGAWCEWGVVAPSDEWRTSGSGRNRSGNLCLSVERHKLQ